MSAFKPIELRTNLTHAPRRTWQQDYRALLLGNHFDLGALLQDKVLGASGIKVRFGYQPPQPDKEWVGVQDERVAPLIGAGGAFPSPPPAPDWLQPGPTRPASAARPRAADQRKPLNRTGKK